MANDGTVKIGTELDQTGFKSGMKGLGSLASKGFGVVGGAAKAMAGITMGALAAVGAGMGALVVSGVKYNAAMEMYTANFSTMLGSEEAAIKKVNELKVLGAKTPFEMADLATATTTLLAFGVEADKSTEILTMLGDVSLGSKEKLDRLSNSFGKVQSQGKLTGETAQMMIEAGFNPLKVIAETTGESMTDLTARMAKGAITADEVTAAFKKATSQGGQFYKGMETASTTFDGLISTLKDNANSLVGEVVKPLSDSMTKTLLPEAIGMIQTLTDGFAKKGIPGLIEAAGQVVGKILTGIAEQAPAVIKMASGFLKTLLDALIDQMPTLATAGTGIVTELLDALLTCIPQILKAGLWLITEIAMGLTESLPTLIPTMQAAITTMVDALVENLPYLLDAGMQILMAIVNGIVSMLPDLISTGSDLIDQLVSILMDNLPAILDAGLEILNAIVDGIVDNIDKVITAVVAIITTIVDNLTEKKNLQRLIDGAINIVTSICMAIANNLAPLLQAAIKIVVALANALLAPENLVKLQNAAIGFFNTIGAQLDQMDWAAIGASIWDSIFVGIWNALVKTPWEAMLAEKLKPASEQNPRYKQPTGLLTKSPIGALVGALGGSSSYKYPTNYTRPQGYATGTDYVPETGLYILHKGEAVFPADLVRQMQGQSMSRSSSVMSESVALRALRDGWSANLPRSSDSGKKGPETIVIPVYIGDKQLEEIVVNAADNYAIKKNR